MARILIVDDSPSQVTGISRIVEKLGHVSLTAEDGAAGVEAAKRELPDLTQWLRDLELKVRVEPLRLENLQRAAQLFNKTNQLNLSTRRLTEAELSAWADAPHRRLWVIHVADRFGDAGLTGILGVEHAGEAVQVVDFLLSCRVMGRQVEQTLVHLAVEWARARGARRVEARHRPTAKNKPTLDFWRGSGFVDAGDGLFHWDAARPFPAPDFIHLTWER